MTQLQPLRLPGEVERARAHHECLDVRVTRRLDVACVDRSESAVATRAEPEAQSDERAKLEQASQVG